VEHENRFGDHITPKPNNTLRIGFQNIGGFPLDKNKHKETIIRCGITHWEFDIFGLAETNTDWRLMDENSKLYFRTKEWWEYLHISFGYNCTSKPITARQFGGTALFSINKSSHRVAAKGHDPTQLGRWAWTLYRGKNNHTLRVISAYRPNPPNGALTVYAQHTLYFNNKDDKRCPRLAFLQDLSKEIQTFMETGDHIILLIDGNTNMKRSDLRSSLESLTLREVILEKHGLNGPSTFRRNNSKSPIDGIWASPGISIQAGGYFDYDEVLINTDHRCLWIDITFHTAFGHNMPAIF
jgi:exonuclease III